jgi:hypothetical protein
MVALIVTNWKIGFLRSQSASPRGPGIRSNRRASVGPTWRGTTTHECADRLPTCAGYLRMRRVAAESLERHPDERQDNEDDHYRDQQPARDPNANIDHRIAPAHTLRIVPIPVTRLADWALPNTASSLQRLSANTSPTVAELRGGGRGKCNLYEWWEPLIDETLEPSQRGAFVTPRVGGGAGSPRWRSNWRAGEL